MGKYLAPFESRNKAWRIWQNDDGKSATDHVQLAVLIDIREALHDLLALLRCPRFTQMPRDIEQIKRNTRRKRKAAR